MALSLKLKTLRFKTIKESSKRKLFLVPYACTFANVIFGFLSVISAFENHYLLASCCIMMAGVMDLIDGRLARAFKTTSCLGMELDSLSDAISFCFAPIILLYCWYPYDCGLLSIVAMALYVCAGVFRLARFNVGGNAASYFTGLPTPIAALSIVFLIIDAPWIGVSPLRIVLKPYGLIFFVCTISFLMISRLKIPSFKNK